MLGMGRWRARSIWFLASLAVVLVLGSGQALAASSTDRLTATIESFEDLGPFKDYEPTSDGGYIAGGSVGNNMYIVKYPEDGEYQWQLTLMDPDGYSLILNSVRQTSDGRFMFSGKKQAASGETQFLYGMLASNGPVQWYHAIDIGGASNDRATAMMETDSGFIVTGEARKEGNAEPAYAVIDSNGDAIAANVIPVAGDQLIYAAVPAVDGSGYMLVGTTGNAGSQAYMVKIDADGSKLGEWTYPDDSLGNRYTVQNIRAWSDSDGNKGYMLVGNEVSDSGQDVLLIKTDVDGKLIWLNTYPLNGTQLGLDVRQTHDGGFIVSGGDNGTTGVLLKTDGTGALQWEKEIAEAGNLYSVIPLADGSYRAAGGSQTAALVTVKTTGAPRGLTVDDTLNQIVGMTGEMEYSTDKGGHYASFDPSKPPIFSGDAEIWVRYKAGDGYDAGEATVLQFHANPVVASVQTQSDISAAYGTPLESLGLPATVEITLSDNSKTEASVTWDNGNPLYNESKPGVYTFTGLLSLPGGVTNPSGLTATQQVRVAEKASTGGNSGPASDPNAVTQICDGHHACSVSFGNEASIQLPEGSWDGTFSLTIRKITVPADMVPGTMTPLSPVFELTKSFEGPFKKSITLRFRYDENRLGSGQRPALFYYDEQAKQWVEANGTAENGETVAEANHFTKFAVFGVARTEEEPAVSFNDLKGHWAESDVLTAAKAGIVSGYEDGSFKPDAFVTRAEFAVMLMHAAANGAARLEAEELAFADAAQIPDWAQEAVSQAVESGAVTGYEDGTYRPSASISRAEMAAMLVRAFRIPAAADAKLPFADVLAGPEWAREPIQAAWQAGLIQGRTNGVFAPDAALTRAEAAVILLRATEL